MVFQSCVWKIHNNWPSPIETFGTTVLPSMLLKKKNLCFCVWLCVCVIWEKTFLLPLMLFCWIPIMSNNMFNGVLHIIGLALTLVGNRTEWSWYESNVCWEKEKKIWGWVNIWRLIADLYLPQYISMQPFINIQHSSFKKIVFFKFFLFSGWLLSTIHPP